MITQLASEKLEDIVEIQLFEDNSELPVVYHVVVRQNGEQINAIEHTNKQVAYGVFDGLREYYLSKNKV